MKKVAIIGGGVTGLSAAYAIKNAIENGTKNTTNIDYLLIEKSPILGGKIATIRTKDGFVVEGGPDCFVSTKPWVFELAKKLNFENKLICSNDEHKKTYILVNNKLRELPDGIMMMVPTKIMPFITTDLFSWPGKIRMAMDIFIPKKKDSGDESLASFVKRRLGQEALDRIAEPLVAGIHAGDPDTMSLAATFPNFLEMEQKYGSLIKGMLAGMKNRPKAGSKANPQSNQNSPRPKRTFFMSFKGGMLDIIDELINALDKNKIMLNTEVIKIEEEKGKEKNTSYKLYLSNGEMLEVDALILASPANATANIVKDVDEILAKTLDEIPQVSSATVTLAYHKKDLKKPIDGFGFVVPSVEGRKIMASTFSSIKWSYRVPNDEYVLIRAFVGGAKAQHLALMPDDEMIKAVKSELRNILGIESEPINVWIFRWEKGMPQYTLGHLDRINMIEKRLAEHEGMYVAGGSYKGVGVPDCINSGNKAAEAVINYLGI